MADIELVIKIPEEAYNLINGKIDIANIDLYSTLIVAVKNGTPLPKGHGRLIDADAYREEMLNSREFDFFQRLDMQSTIIEADKAESEEV